MPTKPTPANVLAEHADAIRRLGKQTVENIVEIGRRLVECRDRHLDHGQWLPWLEREFQWSRQTADNFIHVYEARAKLPKFGNLILPVSGLYLLAAPSTPEAAKTEIIKRAEAGETLPVEEVKQIIQRAKGRKKPARKPSPPALTKPESAPPPAVAEAVLPDKCPEVPWQAVQSPVAPASNGEVLCGEPSHPSLDIMDNMRRADPEHGPAKALALLASVPYHAAMAATRETVGGLVDKALNPDGPPSRDDVGPASNGEVERLRTRCEELERENRRLEQANAALQRENDELRALLPSGDPGPIPASCRRAVS
jgi:hypothetical protein